MKIIGVLVLALLTSSAMAEPCSDTGESEQWVLVVDGIAGHAFWKVNPEEIHPLELTNGFKAGLQISPVPDEYYQERLEKNSATPEIVRIDVFDLSGDSPVLLTHTYGGSNSLQGYSSRGGADTVEEFGSEGLTFLLNKAHCITQEKLANQ